MVSSLSPFSPNWAWDQFYFQSNSHLDLSIPIPTAQLGSPQHGSTELAGRGVDELIPLFSLSLCRSVPCPAANLAFLEHSLNWLPPCIGTSSSSQSLLNQVYIPFLLMLLSIYLLSLLSCGSPSILLIRVNARNPAAFRLPDRDQIFSSPPVQLGRWDKFKNNSYRTNKQQLSTSNILPV